MIRLLALLRADTRAVAAVEAGITLSVLLVPVLAAIVGAGQGLTLQYRLDRATHMGLLYAWGTPTGAATTANVVSAAQAGFGTASSTSTAPTASISASLACYCLDQTGTRTGSTTTTVSCTGTCSGGQVLGKWITVTATSSFTPLLVGSWGGGAWTLKNTSTARIQ